MEQDTRVSRVAIVTGGGSGIGRAVGLALGRAGWRVALAGRREAQLDAVCAEGSDDLVPIQTDVTDENSVRHLFDQTVTRLGRVDLLFNNAGAASSAAGVADIALSDWSAIIGVNLTGAFLCAR